MRSLEIPYGHRVKILKKLKEFKSYRQKNAENDVGLETDKEVDVSNQTFTEMGIGIGTNDELISSRNNKNAEFDEEEQHRLFREAVEKFRNAKEEEESIQNKASNKKISIIREVNEEGNEVNHFYYIKKIIDYRMMN